MTRRIDQVAPGTYRVRMVKNGPWMPVEVRHDLLTDMLSVFEPNVGKIFEISAADYADAVTACVMDGDAFEHPLIRIAWFGELIDRATFDNMVEWIDWARKHEPRHPVANPTKPIDLNTMPVDLIV